MQKYEEIWIPVGTPCHLNIPCLAMGTEAATQSKQERMSEPTDMLTEMGSRAADWLIQRAAKQLVEFYVTREYRHPRTAVYQNWLVFKDCKTADDFSELCRELKLEKLLKPKC